MVHVRKGSKKYWRIIVKAMLMFKKLFRDSVKSKLAEREAVVEGMQEALKMNNEMAKAWVFRAAKKLFVSLFTDQTLNLDYD